MSYASQTYTGSGIVGPYAVPFPYLAQSHVKVYLDGVLTTAYTWPTTSSIQFTSAVGSGVAIVIQRETPQAERLVDYQDATQVLASDLNDSDNQNFFLIQELLDKGLLGSSDGTLDAGGKRIKNLADGVDASDAVTMDQLAAAAIAPAGTLAVENGGTGGTTQAAARAGLGLGTAATRDAGTASGNVPILAGASQLPALDGSLLTGVVAASVAVANVANLGDYFSVHKNGTNQTGVANGSTAQITFSTEVADTANKFDTGTGRFTPGNGEVWLLNARMRFAAANDGMSHGIVLFRNGSLHQAGNDAVVGSIVSAGTTGTWLVVGNGTDYFDVRVTLSNSGSSRDILGASSETFFQGVRIK